MQKTNKVPLILFITSIVSAFIFTVVRILLLKNNFDFNSGFFSSRPLATAFYLSLLVLALFFVFIKKKTVLQKPLDSLDNFAKGITNRVFNLILTLLFILLALFSYKELTFNSTIEKATYYLIAISSLISAVYYLFFLVLGGRKLYAFNILPIITVTAIIIYSFIRQSIFANTYDEFSSTIALGAIAFSLLSEGKTAGEDSVGGLFTSYLALIPLVLQWVFPNLVIKELGRVEFIAIIISAVYLISAVVKTVIIIKEDKK